MKRFLSFLATGALALTLSTSASAQTRGIAGGSLILDDGSGHTLTVETPPMTCNTTYVLPLIPCGVYPDNTFTGGLLPPGSAEGDMLYWNATTLTWTDLGIGTAGQVLTVVGSDPSWQASVGGAADGLAQYVVPISDGAGNFVASSLTDNGTVNTTEDLYANSLNLPNSYSLSTPATDNLTLQSIDNTFNIVLNTDNVAAGAGLFTLSFDGQDFPAFQFSNAAMNIDGTSTALELQGSAGSSGQFLESQGGGATPIWANVDASTLTGGPYAGLDGSNITNLTGGNVNGDISGNSGGLNGSSLFGDVSNTGDDITVNSFNNGTVFGTLAGQSSVDASTLVGGPYAGLDGSNITNLTGGNVSGDISGNSGGLNGSSLFGDVSNTGDDITVNSFNNGTTFGDLASQNAANVSVNAANLVGGPYAALDGSLITNITASTDADLTGPVTSVGNATTIAATGVTTGTYGDATHVGSFTVNAAGQLTGASSVTITGAAPTGAAGGDLAGTYPNPTVGNVSAAVIDAAGAITNNTSGTASFATTAGGAPPTGAAGGGLSGTYPNPTVASVSAAVIDAAGAITNNTSGTASFATTAGGAPPTGAAGGGLSGTYPNPTVASVSAAVVDAAGAITNNTSGTAANVTGTVAVVNGGTGQTTYTNGQLLIGNTTGSTLTKSTLTAGSGITITNGTGTITIATSGVAPAPVFGVDATGNLTLSAAQFTSAGLVETKTGLNTWTTPTASAITAVVGTTAGTSYLFTAHNAASTNHTITWAAGTGVTLDASVTTVPSPGTHTYLIEVTGTGTTVTMYQVW